MALPADNATLLDRLYALLQERKNANGASSYVASLYAGGSEKIAAKIREEAEEFIAEALALETDKNHAQTQKNIRNEGADLLFHVLVLLAHHNVPPSDILDILAQRFGTSGHVEKAARPQKVQD